MYTQSPFVPLLGSTALIVLTLTACNKDDIAPVITLQGAASLTAEAGTPFVDPGATAEDDVDGTVDVVVTGAVDTGTVGDYILSYDAVDEAGNAAETVTRTVSVVDTTPPELTLNGDASISLLEGTGFTDPGATATDNLDADVTVTVTGTVDADVAGTYSLSYGAVDSSGNAANPVQRTVRVNFDGSLVLVGDGADLVLLGVRTDGTLMERSRASLGDEIEGYNPNHVMFGTALDPVSGVIYGSSFNECGSSGNNDIGCWGNGRIDRFSYDVSSVTYEGLAYLAQPPLRLGTPAYDLTSGKLTTTVRNQGETPLQIASLTDVSPPADTTFATSCEGVTLVPGDTCDVVFTSASAFTESAGLQITTDVAVFRGRVYFDSGLELHRAAIDSIDWNEAPLMPVCAAEAWGTTFQYGACAMTALAVTPDGQRVVVNEDDNDQALVFAVKTDGTLEFRTESSDGVSYQGIAIGGSGSHVYNGSNAYSLDGAFEVSMTSSGRGGNATEVVTLGGSEFLVGTINNASLEIHSLAADPASPELVSSWTPPFRGVSYQHHSADSSVFAVVASSTLATAFFDGTALTEGSSLEIPVEVPDCGECDYRAVTRYVQVTPDGRFAITGTFINPGDAFTDETLPYKGVVRSYAINATTGELTEVDRMTSLGMVRSMLLVPTP